MKINLEKFYKAKIIEIQMVHMPDGIYEHFLNSITFKDINKGNILKLSFQDISDHTGMSHKEISDNISNMLKKNAHSK